MTDLPATTENILLVSNLIFDVLNENHTSSNILAEMLAVKPNTMKGKCYIASAALYQFFDGNNLNLYRKKDIAGEYHWWCITDDGIVIDITSSQYEIEGLPIPSQSITGAEKMKPLWFPSLKDKVSYIIKETRKRLAT